MNPSNTVQPQQTLESVGSFVLSGLRSEGEICAFAGVAQLVEHRFCKPKVRSSSLLSSSDLAFGVGSKKSTSVSPSSKECVRQNQVGCPSGQREQAVNLPALAYVGSNPTPTTNIACASLGVSTAGVAQLVERQPSKLNVAGSTPVSRSAAFSSSETMAMGRENLRNRGSFEIEIAHIAQSVERVLGKDEVTSSNLVVGSLFGESASYLSADFAGLDTSAVVVSQAAAN